MIAPCDGKGIALCLAGVLLASLLAMTGCMNDNPDDGDMPWSPASERDAMIPLPSSMYNRYN